MMKLSLSLIRFELGPFLRAISEIQSQQAAGLRPGRETSASWAAMRIPTSQGAFGVIGGRTSISGVSRRSIHFGLLLLGTGDPGFSHFK
jgi:hypothetical protein